MVGVEIDLSKNEERAEEIRKQLSKYL